VNQYFWKSESNFNSFQFILVCWIARRLSRTTMQRGSDIASRRTSAKISGQHRAVGGRLFDGGPRVGEESKRKTTRKSRAPLSSVCPRASVKQTSPALFLPPFLLTLPRRRSLEGLVPRGRHMSSAGGAAATG